MAKDTPGLGTVCVASVVTDWEQLGSFSSFKARASVAVLFFLTVQEQRSTQFLYAGNEINKNSVDKILEGVHLNI